jgi:hypothetical protein
MEEAVFRGLTGTVQAVSNGRVSLSFGPGQTLDLPQNAVHGQAELGKTVRIVAFVPGSSAEEGDVVSRAILNELLSPPPKT